MPTLFRLFVVVGVLFAIGYGAMAAMVTYLVPNQREIVQVVTLPQSAEVSTGRSAAERLTGEASLLVRKKYR